MTEFLILKLQGPMQAWGEHSFEGIRPSGNFPTRSALLGLLGACLGIRRNEYIRLQQLADSVQFAVRKDSRQVKKFGGDVKTLPVIKMTDYHTILEARKKYIGVKTHENSIQTWREYLLDAEYTVTVWTNEGAEVCLAELEAAVQKPVFTPYMGRRCCPLAQPLFRQRLEAADALKALQSVGQGGGVVYSDINISGTSDQTIRLRDVPMPGQPRQFASRNVYIHGGDHVSE
jgi:CRISPR system Cascade subunit CasD